MDPRAQPTGKVLRPEEVSFWEGKGPHAGAGASRTRSRSRGREDTEVKVKCKVHFPEDVVHGSTTATLGEHNAGQFPLRCRCCAAVKGGEAKGAFKVDVSEWPLDRGACRLCALTPSVDQDAEGLSLIHI